MLRSKTIQVVLTFEALQVSKAHQVLAVAMVRLALMDRWENQVQKEEKVKKVEKENMEKWVQQVKEVHKVQLVQLV